MNSPKVSIIVLNWNGKDDTIQCVKSLQLVNYDNYDIIIVDNSSKDDSVITFKNQIPGIEIIQNRRNLGFAGGNNVGIQKALKDGARYILILNNDTIVDSNFLVELVNVAKGNGSIGILGPKIYSFNNINKVVSHSKKFNLWTCNFNLSPKLVEDKEKIDYEEVDYLDGCCMLFDSKIIKKVGYLDPDYFLYWEETDWCYRILKAGYKIIYVPTSKIWHKISASSGSSMSYYYYNKNMFLFIKKNGTKLDAIIFLLFFAIIRFWVQLLVLLLFHRNSSNLISFLKGTIDGIHTLFSAE